MNPILLLTFAVAVSMLIIPLVWRFAPRLGLVDMPDPRKVHTSPVPRVGGWGITAGMLLPLLLLVRPDPLLLAFAFGSLVLFVFGVWDDAREIGHWPKFVGQILAAGVVVYLGDLYITRLPFVEGTLDPAVGRPFTLFALVGMINAINHSDGLDGLAGGESMLSLIALALLGYLSANTLLIGIALATIGGILGFLRFNSHPARVFMGDCGSQVLGFTLGVLAVYLTQVANTAVSAALPLLVLGVPIADILGVLFQRIRGGMNWFRATRNHVHHRLLELGFDHYETVVIIYSIQSALVMSAVLMRYESDLIVTLTYLFVIVSLFGVLLAAERRGWKLRRRAGSRSRLAVAAGWLRDSRALRNAPLVLISAITPAVMLLGALWVDRVPRDFAILAGVLAAVVAVENRLPRAAGSLVARLTAYVTAIFSAYLITHYPGIVEGPVRAMTLAVMIVLAVAIGAYIRFAAEQKFRTTPTDYLIVFGLLALTVFGSINIGSRAVVEAIFYATVLMYGCEVVIDRVANRRVLHVATLMTLATLAVRGVV
jgi:UDP-GlcNAc:undecaprenyl-phosphate GlcNAc-1-phosphate transferase